MIGASAVPTNVPDTTSPILPRHDRERVPRFESRHALANRFEAAGTDGEFGG